MNWWLVSHHLKHGMMTVRPTAAAGTGMAMEGMQHEAAGGGHTGHAVPGDAQAAAGAPPAVGRTALLSFVALAAGLAIAAAIASIG
jgi:hypothetical protein